MVKAMCFKIAIRLKNINKLITSIQKDQGGQILVGVLIIMVFFMAVLVAASEYSFNHFSNTKRTLTAVDALAVAEAGADLFLYNLNHDSTYAGTSEVTLYSDPIAKVRGTIQSVAVNGTIPNEKIVTITGRMYLPQAATTPKVTRKIKLILHGTNPTPPILPGTFNLPMDVLSGPDNDSLTISNNASIRNGRVHSNGGIRLANLGTIGSVATPVPVTVSNSAGIANPIFIQNNGHIYGDVKANMQADGSGMDNSGLVSSSGVAPVAFPNYNRAAHIAAASPPVSGAVASCNGLSVTWPANYHVSGDVDLTNCNVTVMGDVWIEGTLTSSGNTVIQVSSAISAMPIMMIDGGPSGGVFMNNNAAFTQNAAGYGFIVISYNTSAQSITLNNSSDAVGSVLYSPGGTISFNNNSGIGTRAVWGYRIQMNNAFQLTLGAPGSIIWTIGYYQQDFS